LKSRIRKYTEISLIVRRYNNVFGGYILPITQSVVVLATTLMSYLLIIFYAELRLPMLGLFGSAIVACLLFEGIGIRSAGRININSKQVITKMKQSNQFLKSKQAQLSVSSLQDLRIAFGFCNFLETNTCLVTFQFTLSMLVNLLLTHKT